MTDEALLRRLTLDFERRRTELQHLRALVREAYGQVGRLRDELGLVRRRLRRHRPTVRSTG